MPMLGRCVLGQQRRTEAQHRTQGLGIQIVTSLAQRAFADGPGLSGAQRMVEERIQLRLQAAARCIDQKRDQPRQAQLASASKRAGPQAGLISK